MTLLWLGAVLSVAVMGFAIQRGATCTVAAVDEVLSKRRAHRLLALMEASLWVAGGLALARLVGPAGLAGSMPVAYEASAWTLAGVSLLGLGAWVNRACVFGAVARLCSGEWACAATPVGFYLGCLSVAPVFSRPDAQQVQGLQAAPLDLTGSAAFVGAFAAWVLWRLWPGLRAMARPGRARWLKQAVWAPHAATVVIGISFFIMLLMVGRWAYTDVLADLARTMGGMPVALVLPVLLLLALYAGARVGTRQGAGNRWRQRPQPCCAAWPGACRWAGAAC